MTPWVMRTKRDKIIALRHGDEVIGFVSDKEFESLFGFFPRVDIKLTPQQDEELCAYIKRRDGKQ